MRLWDPRTGLPVGEPLNRRDGFVEAVCALPGASPDGAALLASGGADGTVRLWDPRTGAPVGEPLTGHDGPVLAVCVLLGAGPDGSVLLASGGQDLGASRGRS